MDVNRAALGALAAAALVAVAMPVVLLMPGPLAVDEPASPPLLAVPRPPLVALSDRALFVAAPDGADAAAPPADAPQLVGIVGRIGRDAVAMVRGGDGAGRTLAVGESVDGWRLESLAIDAAFFMRGTRRLRVPLPAG